MARSKRSTLTGNLLGLLVLLVGFFNWGSDRTLSTYHNDFAQEAYQEVLFVEWNALAALMRKEGATLGELEQQLRTRFVPAVDRWLEKGKLASPPSFAEEFHARLMQGLWQLSTKGKDLALVAGKDDAEGVSRVIEVVGKQASVIEADFRAFQERMKTERNFRFEDSSAK